MRLFRPPLSFWLSAGAVRRTRSAGMERLIRRRLQALVCFAYQRSPYYRDLLDRGGVDWREIRGPEDLARLPLLDKATLIARMPDLLTVPPSQKMPPTRYTTGTSGAPLQLPVSTGERWFDILAWLRVYRQAGLSLRDRQVKMRIPNGPFTGHRVSSALGFFPREYLSSLEPAAAKVEFLRRRRPGALFGHASMMGSIARELERRDERLRIPLLFSTSDMLWPGLRQLIEDRLTGTAYDVYGSVEAGPMACECREHRGLHVNSELVILELLDEQGRPAARGRVVCTVLWRRTVPLIRYALGDWAEWAADACPCGDVRPRLAALHGREHELIRLSDGEWVSAGNLVSAMLTVPGIRQFQVVQETERRIRYRMVTAPDYPAWGDERVLMQFRDRFGDRLDPVVEHVPRIEQDPATKFAPFISLARARALNAATKEASS